eukprot:scaffold8529_cov137-Cylindrotheca_fusiformis.AAC.7
MRWRFKSQSSQLSVGPTGVSKDLSDQQSSNKQSSSCFGAKLLLKEPLRPANLPAFPLILDNFGSTSSTSSCLFSSSHLLGLAEVDRDLRHRATEFDSVLCSFTSIGLRRLSDDGAATVLRLASERSDSSHFRCSKAKQSKAKQWFKVGRSTQIKGKQVIF